MAVFYLRHSFVGRSPRHKIRSTLAAASYRAGVKLIEERTGETHNYSRKKGVLHDEIGVPKGAPSWTLNRGELWNRLEYTEDQSTRPETAQLAHNIEMALPHELTLERQIFLVRDFVREQFGRKSFVADWAIHAAPKDGDKRNVHAHILIPLRPIAGARFGPKPRTYGQLSDQVKHWRAAWAHLTNRHLARYGIAARVEETKRAPRPVPECPRPALSVKNFLGNRKKEIGGQVAKSGRPQFRMPSQALHFAP